MAKVKYDDRECTDKDDTEKLCIPHQEKSTPGQEWEGPSKGTVFRGTNIPDVTSDVTVLRTLPTVTKSYEEPPGRAEEEDIRRDSNPRDHCEETLDYNQLSIHKVLANDINYLLCLKTNECVNA